MKKRNDRRTLGFLILTAVCLLMTLGCDDSNDDSDSTLYEVSYSDAKNWVATSSITKDVDLFYLYPTVSSNATGSMDITDETERNLAKGIFMAQASLFEKNANVFAPYYRQVSTEGRPETPGGDVTDCSEFMTGLTDVLNAFDYFIEHYNQGRPFIIAGHSQGANVALELIKKRLGENAALRDKLVAAYIIGCTVTDADLETAQLSAAKNATDIGVVITYNTQAYGVEPGPMLTEGALCINPINWRTDNMKAEAIDNLGARIYDNDTGAFIEEVADFCSAEVDPSTGALLTVIPDNYKTSLDFGTFSEGVYHRYDYAFYYRNLEENVGERVKAYLGK